MDLSEASTSHLSLKAQLLRVGLKKREKCRAFLMGNQQVSGLHSQVTAYCRTASYLIGAVKDLHFGLTH